MAELIKNTPIIKTESKWKNPENNAFFEEIKVEGLKKLAIKAGLSTGCDVELLMPYWQDAESILDVGAGYGRAIDFLLNNNFNGSITALERNNCFFQHLKQHYDTQANLLHDDIKNYSKISQKFDTILFLWSGLAEFPPSDQAQVIKNLSSLLKKNGTLIIDTMPVSINKPLDTEEFGQQSFLTRAETSVIHTYEASQEEIKSYAKYSNFFDVKLLSCETDTKRIRWIYVLS